MRVLPCCFLFALLIVDGLLSVPLQGQTVVSGGNVSGIWALSGSPYLLEADVTIAPGATLVIEAGVLIQAQAEVDLIVRGRILAIGSEDQNIQFTATDTIAGWGGLEFHDTATNDSEISHGSIQFAEEGLWIYLAFPTLKNLSIRHNEIGLFGNSNLSATGINEFTDVDFYDNKTGFYASWTFRSIFTNCNFFRNDIGIYLNDHVGANDELHFRRCEVYKNRIGFFTEAHRRKAILTHCTITDNEEAEVQVVISNTFRTNLEIKESILWGGPFEDGIAIGGDPTIVASYSNISLFTGTWEGVGNINEDPLFLLPEADDYHLQCGSPCIDVGDPAGELDPDQSRADIGANPYIGSDQGVIITSNSPLCTGDTLILSAEGGLNYEWNGPNLFTGTGREIIIPAHDQNIAGIYTVVVTTAEGCQLQSSTEVILEEGPSLIVTGELNLCKGESTTLIASGADSYQWSTEEEEESITVSPIETTNYILAGASNSGCSSSLSLTVVVNPLPDINIIGDTLVCVGENLELVAEGGGNYQWNTGEEGNTISINPSESSEYFVIGVNSVGCESTATHFITTSPLPLVSISGDLKICEGQSSMLSAKGGVSYRWSTGEAVADIEVMPTVSSTYQVTITSDFGCENQGSALVNVNPLPIVMLEERDSFCVQEEAFLLTKGFPVGGVYSGPGVMNNSFDPSLAGLGNHQIVYTYEDEEGCTASTNLAITVNSCEMTGTENFNDKIAVQVYPNPTEGGFNIEMGSSLIGGELKIMGLSGKVLMHQMQVPIRLSIDHLPKGMYIIQVQQEKVRTVKKLIVQ